jgi:hypothetical protein
VSKLTPEKLGFEDNDLDASAFPDLEEAVREFIDQVPLVSPVAISNEFERLGYKGQSDHKRGFITRSGCSAMLRNRHLTLLVISLLITAVPAVAQSRWLESKSTHYTIFYQAGFEKDSETIRTWLNQIEKFMKVKYKITPDHYHVSIYLLSSPEGGISIDQSGQNQCCTRDANGIKTGLVRLLTMSAPIWKGSNLKSSLGLEKSGEDYHYKVLMAEYIPIAHYAAQDTRKRGGWNYYSAPEWFVQGLQEYDAIFHTTEQNRTQTSKRLTQWARRSAAKFSCCSPTLQIADPYNGGATFLAFLAAEFGEDIHARLLRSQAKSFDEAFGNETKPYSLPQLFAKFQKWLEQHDDPTKR